MNKLLFLLLVLVSGCTSHYKGVPEKYHQLLDSAIISSGENKVELLSALTEAPDAHKEAMAFLIAYMPERDLRSMKSSFLTQQVALAFDARNRYPWAKAVPYELFLNDVLPYVVMNETREDWRSDFVKRFDKYVSDCTTLEEAIIAVNRNIRDEVQVDYNTQREKPDQSPFESIRQGMASCSGLSILLVDAFRSVGIPARVAGTPNWHDNRGNHNWVEVWLNGKWYFTEFYFNQLDHAWFLADAGKAQQDKLDYAIYASSYAPRELSFPLVWDMDIKYVWAENVTERYVKIYSTRVKEMKADGDHVTLRVSMFGEEKKKLNSADRVATNIDLFYLKDQMGGGRTSGPTQDMNDELEFLVPKNKVYSFKYADKNGNLKEVQQKVGEENQSIRLFL